MDTIKRIADLSPKFSKNSKPDSHLHSPAHLLADELSVKLNDRKHFALYLGMAMRHDHQFLRSIMGQVLESKTVATPGKLFAYLVKKSNKENSNV